MAPTAPCSRAVSRQAHPGRSGMTDTPDLMEVSADLMDAEMAALTSP
jgi:hypothetical protein